MKPFHIVYLFVLVPWLTGCGTDTSPGQTLSDANNSYAEPTQITKTTTGSSPDNQGISSMTLKITDAPIDNATRVMIKFDAVELRQEDSDYSVLFELNQPQSINLLELQGTRSADLLTNIAVEAGIYDELRLIIDDSEMNSFIELNDGSIHDLKIPSGSSSGLKIKGELIVPANRPALFTIDFDVRKSIVRAGNSSKYLLKPVLRLVDDTTVGHVRGSVDADLLIASSCSDADVDSHNAVYIFNGADALPDDIDQSSDDDVEPVTTTSIEYDASSDSYVFEAAYLEAGEYTLAITCNANLEDIEADDDLLFFDIQNITVQVNSTLFL